MKIFQQFLFFFCAGVFSLSASVHAASDGDGFTIRTLVGGDTTPPSVPANVLATPVALSQINLSWDASTDNYILSGYQVYRDANLAGTGTPNFIQIATTTATNYSDVGLAASTTYSYYITAFDSFNNVSASSTVVATTTLASTTPPDLGDAATTSSSDPRRGNRIHFIELVNLEIVPDTTSVDIRYVTRGYVRGVLRWGKTSSYELGSISERSFSQVHGTTIPGLWPGERYYFTIEGENSVGRVGVLTSGTFTTVPPRDIFPPSNVANLRAYRADADIVLEWTNPTEQDFEYIRIIRNNRSYPSDPNDGWFIYEGSETRVVDKGAATKDGVQFYTVFSYDTLGNVSSGAVVRVTIGESDFSAPGPEDTTPTTTADTSPFDISFEDIVFIQDGITLENNGSTVAVDGSKQLIVSIPYGALPTHLKTIVLALSSEEQRKDIGSFLLRIDSDREHYTTTLTPLRENGRFPITLSIFDFETNELARVTGVVISSITHTTRDEDMLTFLAYFKQVLFSVLTSLWLWGILIALSLIWFFVRKRKEKERSIAYE